MIGRLLSHVVRVAAALAVGIALVVARRRRAVDSPAGERASAQSPLKHWLWHGAAVVLVLGAAGALGVLAGLVPIAASAGHWPITRWLLSFAMHRAVATRSRE